MKSKWGLYLWVILAGFLAGFLISLLRGLATSGGPKKGAFVRLEMAQLEKALRDYKMKCGQFPSGASSNVLQALFGDNSKKIRFLFVQSRQTNSHGLLIDRWKTPYDIQILGQTNFIIRSAGPNRILGDKDDIISDSGSNHPKP